MVRTFTSVQENAPLSMLVGCLLGVLTHGTICAQIVAYASSSSSSSSEAVKTEKKAKKME
jgi:mannose-P-dolichol utilization defect protein 1